MFVFILEKVSVQLEFRCLIKIVFLFLLSGESTAAGRLLNRDHFGDKLKDFIKGKLTTKRPAVWGTCSGLIMLANELENQKQGGQYHVSFFVCCSFYCYCS